jgi:hypothetical protein
MNARDKIKSAQDRPQETINIPEWGVTLTVKGMSAANIMEMSVSSNSKEFASNLLCLSIYDEEGNRVYSTPAEAEELSDKSYPIVQLLLTAARRVNGLLDEEVKKD